MFKLYCIQYESGAFHGGGFGHNPKATLKGAKFYNSLGRAQSIVNQLSTWDKATQIIEVECQEVTSHNI